MNILQASLTLGWMFAAHPITFSLAPFSEKLCTGFGFRPLDSCTSAMTYVQICCLFGFASVKVDATKFWFVAKVSTLHCLQKKLKGNKACG